MHLFNGPIEWWILASHPKKIRRHVRTPMIPLWSTLSEALERRRRCLPMSASPFWLKSDPFANTVSHLLRVARPAVMFSIGGSSSIRVKPKMVSHCKAMCYRKLANCSGRVTAIGDIHVASKVLSVVFPDPDNDNSTLIQSTTLWTSGPCPTMLFPSTFCVETRAPYYHSITLFVRG